MKAITVILKTFWYSLITLALLYFVGIGLPSLFSSPSDLGVLGGFALIIIPSVLGVIVLINKIKNWLKNK